MSSRPWFGALCLALLGLAGCLDGGGTRSLPSQGDALNVGGGAGVGIRGMVPGHRYIDMIPSFTNESRDPAKLHRIEPVGLRNSGRVAEIYRIRIGPGAGPSGGLFYYDPPASFERGRCRTQEVVPVRGHVVQPGEDPWILLYVHVLRRGTFEARGLRIVYEQNGDLYHQVMHYEIKVDVKGWNRPVDHAESRCAKGEPMSPVARLR